MTNACKNAPADYWMWDGIHPTVAGHELLAREWITVVGKKLPFVKLN
jgi:phospholipase/lecithinase/hemolysin